MQEAEFWCRAFLAAMGGNYTDPACGGLEHGAAASYCEKAADAALAVAQRRGMVMGEQAPNKASKQPELERVAFTTQRDLSDAGLWYIGVHGVGAFRVGSEVERATLDTGAVIRIAWGESMPPQPIEVWIERPKGGA